MSTCRITLPSWMIGEAAKPHCRPGSLKPPAFRPPSSCCQWIAPSIPRQASPAVGKTTTRCSPSVTGVELAWVALKWRLVSGTPRPTSVSQTFSPVALSKASTSQRCSLASSTSSPAPVSPVRSGTLPPSATAVVT